MTARTDLAAANAALQTAEEEVATFEKRLGLFTLEVGPCHRGRTRRRNQPQSGITSAPSASHKHLGEGRRKRRSEGLEV